MGRLRLALCPLGRTHPPLPQAHRRQALQVRRLRALLLPLRPPGPAHEAAPELGVGDAPPLALYIGTPHCGQQAPQPAQPSRCCPRQEAQAQVGKELGFVALQNTGWGVRHLPPPPAKAEETSGHGPPHLGLLGPGTERTGPDAESWNFAQGLCVALKRSLADGSHPAATCPAPSHGIRFCQSCHL